MKKALNKKEKVEIMKYLSERFGMNPNVFKGLAFFKTKKKIYITTKSCINNQLFKDAETAGIAILRPNHVLKPTTDFLQLFGKYAKKNVIDLTPREAEKFIMGQDLELDPERTKHLTTGYVIVVFKTHVLGCANFKQNILKNMLPKSRRTRIKLKPKLSRK